MKVLRYKVLRFLGMVVPAGNSIAELFDRPAHVESFRLRTTSNLKT
jgi:hypothetical protein